MMLHYITSYYDIKPPPPPTSFYFYDTLQNP